MSRAHGHSRAWRSAFYMLIATEGVALILLYHYGHWGALFVGALLPVIVHVRTEVQQLMRDNQKRTTYDAETSDRREIA